MFIRQYLKSILSKQRGSIIVLTALLLPIIVACGGLVIDMGYIYSHYSRLENTAISASMAGGIAFKNYDEGVEDDEHPMADAAAEDYTQINEDPDNIITIKTKAKQKDGYKMYRVVLYEDVPFHFLRPLLAMINVDNYISIQATGYCRIIEEADEPGTEGTPGTPATPGSIFDNLFLFSESFHAINNLGSHGENDIQRLGNCSTYDGNIRAAQKNALDHANFDIQNLGVTSEAFKDREHFYVSNRDRGGSDYDEKYKLDMSEGSNQINKPYYDSDIDITSYYEETIKPMESADRTYIIHSTSDNVLRSENINDCISKGYNAICTDDNFNNGTSLEFSINNAILGGPSDEPFYIITKKFGNFNINADLTNSRPIILVSSGVNVDLKFQSNTKGFNGVLYAPYGNVYLNDNRMHFTGSVVAKNITTGEQAYYKQWDNPLGTDGTPGTEGTEGTPGKPSNHRVVMGGSDDW